MKITLKLKRGTSMYKVFELKNKTIIHVHQGKGVPRVVVVSASEYRR